MNILTFKMNSKWIMLTFKMNSNWIFWHSKRIKHPLPGFAPSRNLTGWSLYSRKYSICPISWCVTNNRSMFTSVHCFILKQKPTTIYKHGNNNNERSNSFLTRIGSSSKLKILTLVFKIVLHVTHFVMSCDEPLLCDGRALLNSVKLIVGQNMQFSKRKKLLKGSRTVYIHRESCNCSIYIN